VVIALTAGRIIDQILLKWPLFSLVDGITILIIGFFYFTIFSVIIWLLQVTAVLGEYSD